MARTIGVLITCLFGFISLSAQSQIPTQELVFPHLAVGAGWEVEITLVTQGADNSAGQLEFFDSSGQSLSVSVNGGPPSSFVSYSLPNPSSQTFAVSSDGPELKTGWAVVTQALEGNSNQGAINGVMTFRLFDGEKVLSQVGVNPSVAISSGHVTFNNTGTNSTAIAIASANGATLEFNRYNQMGTFQDSKLLNLAPGSQQSFFLGQEFPDSREQRGFFIIIADDMFHALALDVNEGQLSSNGILSPVLERDLTLNYHNAFWGDISEEWRLRLVRNGPIFWGIADLQGEVDRRPVTGRILTNGNIMDTLQLHMHVDLNQFLVDLGSQHMEWILMATDIDKDLRGAIEGVGLTVGHTTEGFDVLNSEKGDEATFTLSVPSSAPF